MQLITSVRIHRFSPQKSGHSSIAKTGRLVSSRSDMIFFSSAKEKSPDDILKATAEILSGAFSTQVHYCNKTFSGLDLLEKVQNGYPAFNLYEIVAELGGLGNRHQSYLIGFGESDIRARREADTILQQFIRHQLLGIEPDDRYLLTQRGHRLLQRLKQTNGGTGAEHLFTVLKQLDQEEKLERARGHQLILYPNATGLSGLEILSGLQALRKPPGLFSRNFPRFFSHPESQGFISQAETTRYFSEHGGGNPEALQNTLFHLKNAGYVSVAYNRKDNNHYWKLSEKGETLLKADPLNPLNLDNDAIKAVLELEIEDLNKDKSSRVARLEKEAEEIQTAQTELDELLRVQQGIADALATTKGKYTTLIESPPVLNHVPIEQERFLLFWEDRKMTMEEEIGSRTLSLSMLEKKRNLKQANLDLLKERYQQAFTFQRLWNQAAHQRKCKLNEAVLMLSDTTHTQAALEKMKELREQPILTGKTDSSQDIEHYLRLFGKIEDDFHKTQARAEIETGDKSPDTLAVEQAATLALLQAEAAAVQQQSATAKKQ